MDSFQLPSPIILGLASAAILVVVYIIPRIFGKRKYPLPPGPPGEFLLGHYRVVPFVAAFKKYAEWGKEYSKFVLLTCYTLFAWILLVKRKQGGSEASETYPGLSCTQSD
jgi:hypothetical protein